MARLLIIYHYFYPDDVVSSRHFTQLAEGLEAAGHKVDVLTSNRLCHRPGEILPPESNLGPLRIFRVPRRQVNRSSFLSRTTATALFVIRLVLSLLRLQRLHRYDQIIIGTDPPLFFAAAAILRRLRMLPQTMLWSFDLYPEAVAAAGKMSSRNPIYLALKACAGFAYRHTDKVVTIGSCMSRLITRDGSRPLPVIVPWSFLETLEPQPFPAADFSESATLHLLYSGNLGLAHSAGALEKLVSAHAPVALNIQISGRGQKFNELAGSRQGSRNQVSVLPFVDEKDLPARLSGADVHVVTLEPGWSGVVVPSKFFSALAFGRPVLYFGPPASAIAGWIREFDVGWIADSNLDDVLKDMARVFSQADLRAAMQQRCFGTYQKHFSMRSGIEAFRALTPAVSAGDKIG